MGKNTWCGKLCFKSIKTHYKEIFSLINNAVSLKTKKVQSNPIFLIDKRIVSVVPKTDRKVLPITIIVVVQFSSDIFWIYDRLMTTVKVGKYLQEYIFSPTLLTANS